MCGKPNSAVFSVPELLENISLCHWCILELGYKMKKTGDALVAWAEGRAGDVGWYEWQDGTWRLEPPEEM